MAIGAYGPVKLQYSFTKVIRTMSLFSLVQTYCFCRVKTPEIFSKSSFVTLKTPEDKNQQRVKKV